MKTQVKENRNLGFLTTLPSGDAGMSVYRVLAPSLGLLLPESGCDSGNLVRILERTHRPRDRLR
jgi:hypothetical protein